MGDNLKYEYSKRDKEIENAELYALIEILETLKPMPLGTEPINWDKIAIKIATRINNTIRLLEQKIERSKNG